MATSYYSTGAVSLTNGSAVVTGVGTLWQTALIAAGDIYVEAPGGNVLPILSVDSETQITAELKWMGASGTYNYAIERKRADAENLDKNSESLTYLISELRNGTLFKYEASGDLAGRGLYDTKPKGFGYLVTIGVTEPDFYVKGSAADGDWEGPFAYGVGPVGPQGPVGFLDFKGDYNPATAYVANDGVRYNGSSFVALQDTTGNAPPTLPTTENAYWSLLAIKGQDGTGIGDMVKSVYDPQNRQEDIFSALDSRVRFDAAQSPSVAEQIQGRTNLGLEFGFPLFHAVYELPNGVSGGALGAGVTVRALNTVLVNDFGATLTGLSTVFLPAGTYLIDASAPLFFSLQSRLFLYNSATIEILLKGKSEYFSQTGSVHGRVSLFGRIAFSSTTEVHIASYAVGTKDFDGLGVSTGDGQPNIFSEFKAWKVK